METLIARVAALGYTEEPDYALFKNLLLQLSKLSVSAKQVDKKGGDENFALSKTKVGFALSKVVLLTIFKIPFLSSC